MYSINHISVNVRYLFNVLKRKPLLFARLSKNYILAVIHPLRPPLRFADVAITYQCTMRCEHCSASVMKDDRKTELTVEEYHIIADKLIKAGLLVVNLTGGEPTLRKDLKEIVKAFKPKKMFITIQTNASLLTEEQLRELKYIGIDGINVSIDGADAETHDSFRHSPGAYEKAVTLVKIAKQLGLKVGLSYVLTHENLYSADRVKMVALSKEYGTLLNYNLASPIGFWRGEFNNLITTEDRKYLLRLLEEYPYSKTDFETNYFTKGCSAIKEKVYITAYGEVMPCPFIQVGFGNILTDVFEDIRDRAFQYRYFRTYHEQCLAAEDMDFIKNTVCYDKAATFEHLPIDHTMAFKSRERAMKEQ